MQEAAVYESQSERKYETEIDWHETAFDAKKTK